MEGGILGVKSIAIQIHDYTDNNLIVYYVSRRIMRALTRRATMLAGDRSQGIVEA